MKTIRSIAAVVILIALFSTGCNKTEDSGYSKFPPNYCELTGTAAHSLQTSCNIQFWDIMHKYTYIGIESSFYSLGPPCNRSLFEIKYINSKHDHNEPDYEFVLKMNPTNPADFFKQGTIKINELDIFESKLTGGGGGPVRDVDITLIWDEVLLVGSVYSGKGKFIINKDIPSSFPGYKYPAQEIPFEFRARDRVRK